MWNAKRLYHCYSLYLFTEFTIDQSDCFTLAYRVHAVPLRKKVVPPRKLFADILRIWAQHPCCACLTALCSTSLRRRFFWRSSRDSLSSVRTCSISWFTYTLVHTLVPMSWFTSRNMWEPWEPVDSGAKERIRIKNKMQSHETKRTKNKHNKS